MPFESLAQAERCFAAVSEARLRLASPHEALLVDLRAAPGRSDPGFEQMVLTHVSTIVRGWKRVAHVVASALGRLHVSRHMATCRPDARVFGDPESALGFLLGREEDGRAEV